MSPDSAVLSVTGLVKRFRAVTVLDGVYLDIHRGEVLALIGPSGCGKSTLLRCITLLEEPDDGFITIEGAPFGREVFGSVVRHQRRQTIDLVRPRIGLVFQQLHLWPHLTVLENVVRPQVVVLRRSRHDANEKALALLSKLGLLAMKDRFPYALSGGQGQRVAIARALAMEPVLMLFDEPTSALDPELVGDLLAMLRGLAAGGMTMMVVTHDVGFAAAVAGRIAFMDGGRITMDGPVRQVLASTSIPRLGAFLAARSDKS
jgi:polar amino acid transport system ATP-binding protein